MSKSIFLILLAVVCACSRSGNPVTRIAIFRGEEFTPLAHSLGHFTAEGLEVEIHDLPSTSKAMEALFGGSADVVTGGYDHALRLALEGKRAKSFVVLTVRSPLALVVSPKAPHIRRIEDLKGALVGVSAFGSSGNHFINLLLSRHGLSPKDIHLVATGGGHAVTVASAEQGRVAAIVTLPVSLAVLQARHPRLTILANASTLEGTRQIFGVDRYPGICMMAQASWLEKNGDTAARLARAMVRTLVWAREHTAEQLRQQLPNRSGQPEELEGLRATVAVASPDGRMPPQGPDAVRDVLAATYPAVRTLDLSTTFTADLVR
jgi:NitT/TauT family transport system substrate-binding protein